MKVAWRFLKLFAVVVIVVATAWFVSRNRADAPIDLWPITNQVVKPVYMIFGFGMLFGIALTLIASCYAILSLLASNQKLKREMKKLQALSPQITMKPEPSADVRLSPDL